MTPLTKALLAVYIIGLLYTIVTLFVTVKSKDGQKLLATRQAEVPDQLQGFYAVTAAAVLCVMVIGWPATLLFRTSDK
jgi:hypothetical protein